MVKEYSQMAQELGATTAEVADAAVEWQRQGYNIADTNELIRNSMILSKVGMVESAEAQEYLTSAMKGYQVSVQNSLGIVDKLASVDLEAAVSAGGLAEAMSRTAASAKMAGVDMDKLLGYLAVTGEVTQKSMSQIGESKIIDALKVA
jgi:TP901 family phage tail tape measure protein